MSLPMGSEGISALLCWGILPAAGLLFFASVLDSARVLKRIDKRLARI